MNKNIKFNKKNGNLIILLCIKHQRQRYKINLLYRKEIPKLITLFVNPFLSKIYDSLLVNIIFLIKISIIIIKTHLN